MSALEKADVERSQRIGDLARKIDAGDASSAERAAFARELSEIPDLWRIFADLDLAAEISLVEGLDAADTARTGLRVGRQAIQRDLGHDTAPAIERLLIEQIGLTWLRLQIVQLRHARIVGFALKLKSPIPQVEYWERALTTAQGRYLRALAALARVRRLLGSKAVQVNIGQTVNATQALVTKKRRGRKPHP